MLTRGELHPIPSTSFPRMIDRVKRPGRRSTITPEKTAILLMGLENGLTVKEALIHAGFSQDAYDRRLQKDVQFRGQINTAKAKLVILAKSKIANAIQSGDMPTVRWFLERKVPQEFGRQVMENDESVSHSNITVIVPMGNKPHPRIIPEGESK